MKTISKNLGKNLLIIILIFLFISAIFSLAPSQKPIKEIPLSQLASQINQGEVKRIVVSGDNVLVNYLDGKKAKTVKEADSSISQSLLNYGVTKDKLSTISVVIKKRSGANWALWSTILFGIIPLLFFVWLFWTLSKQAKTGASQVLNFSKAKARLFNIGKTKEKVKFSDVAGLVEAKEELKEIVDFLKSPSKYLRMGARIPKGVLLVGPAGCGKTLLARAVAGESNVPFFSVAGSSFIELFVGVGSSRVRDLFAMAKRSQPCLIFIDELDAVGKVRGPAILGGHEEREQTLNQLLIEMDGFEPKDKVIVLAATNRPDVLDPALLRPGRFDRKIILDLPDIKEREAILRIHCRNKPLSGNVNLREIAERTPGFSGADLENLVNEAAILAARKNKPKIYQEEFIAAFEKVLLGPERKSHILSEREKKISAYHEAGHALVAMSLPGTEPVRKVSIISRGMAAGYTLKLPTEDRHFRTRKEFLNDLAVLLGGYCAEKLIFKDITTGASNDLEKASEIARKIITQYGMSKKLGPIVFGKKESLTFFNKEIAEERNYSEKTAQEIDEEISNLIRTAQVRTEKILKSRRKTLEKIAKTLIKKETIERDELEKLVKK